MFDQIRKSGKSARLRPEVDGLESRQLLTITALTFSASPQVVLPLNPRNLPHPLPTGNLVPVTIAGLLTSTEAGERSFVRFSVVDELGRIQPSGFLRTRPVRTNGPGSRVFFSGRIGLDFHRDPNDPDGRQYTIIVSANDASGSRSGAIVVTAPRRAFPTLRHPRPIDPR